MKLKREEYRAYDAINASLLKGVLSHSYWKASEKFDPTPAMRFGTAAHTMILEPDQFIREYCVFEGDRRTKLGKEEYNSIIDLGRQPIKMSELNALEAMRDSVHSDDYTTKALSDPDRLVEASFSFPSPYIDGVECKSQIDLYTQETLIDLKTIADITKAERQFFNMHYDLQLAFYADCLIAEGYPVKEVKVLFVETQYPHQAAMLTVPEEVLEHGRMLIRKSLDKYFAEMKHERPLMITKTLNLPSYLASETIDDADGFTPL